MAERKKLTTELIFEKMLTQIRTGNWPVGAAIPSERKLMEMYKVSRISVREALAKLRAFGLIQISQGKSTTVCKMNAEIFGKLFPLMLTIEGEQAFENIFEVRLALESRTSYLASLHRTQKDIDQIQFLLDLLQHQNTAALEQFIETDLKFHLSIAIASQNPLFRLLLEALSDFIRYVQVISYNQGSINRRSACHFHESIAEAIIDQDPERARVEMESHLRASANRMIKSGIFGSGVLDSSILGSGVLGSSILMNEFPESNILDSTISDEDMVDPRELEW